MPLSPIEFKKPTDVQEFLDKLEKLDLIQYESQTKQLKNIDVTIKTIKDIPLTEQLLADHLLVTETGETYLLEDVMALSDAEAEAHTVSFINKDGQKRSVTQIRKALKESGRLDVVRNKPLASMLVNASKQGLLNLTVPKCLIIKAPTLFSVLTPTEESFERYALELWLEGKNYHPVNQEQPLTREQLIPNRAIQNWAELNLMQLTARKKCYEQAIKNASEESGKNLRLKHAQIVEKKTETYTFANQHLEAQKAHWKEKINANAKAQKKLQDFVTANPEYNYPLTVLDQSEDSLKRNIKISGIALGVCIAVAVVLMATPVALLIAGMAYTTAIMLPFFISGTTIGIVGVTTSLSYRYAAKEHLEIFSPNVQVVKSLKNMIGNPQEYAERLEMVNDRINQLERFKPKVIPQKKENPILSKAASAVASLAKYSIFTLKNCLTLKKKRVKSKYHYKLELRKDAAKQVFSSLKMN